MTSNIREICWPITRLNETLTFLAERAGFRPKPVEIRRPPTRVVSGDEQTLQAWLDSAAKCLGLEVEPVETSYSELRSFLTKSAPALVQLEFDDERHFLAIVKSGHRTLHVLSPDLLIHRISSRVICALLSNKVEGSLPNEVTALLDAAGIGGRKRRKAMSTILRARLANTSIQNCWLLGIPAGNSFRAQLRQHRLVLRLVLFVTAYACQSVLFVASWWMIGRAVLEGRVDYGWLIAWALVVLTCIPCQLLASWLQGTIVLIGGSVLRRRLLAGSLQLQPAETRQDGVGQLLGRVIESAALESLSMNGGVGGLRAAVEVIIALVVLAAGANNPVLSVLLTAWVLLVIGLARHYIRRRRQWTERRLENTNDLIERMSGHRTRLAQQPREQWHESEDESLAQYLESASMMDRALVRFITIAPHGWLILSVASLIPSLVSGDLRPTTVAVSLGGILLAQGAIKTLSESSVYLGGALIAWHQVKFLFEAAARKEFEGSPDYAVFDQPQDGARHEVLAEAHEIVFQHSQRSGRVLNGCSLRISDGDRILLEGPSGGGKSTLASVLTGLREPQSGLLLLRGLDRQTLGTYAWRHRLSAAPQFHENHILSGTLAFNLLMGRGWPPRPGDCEEAEAVCRELGLGPLLDRMPLGLFQIIGETGWQLSHGERSRVFLARALLQGSDLVVLDESFGSLDPESLRQAMECAQKRARTLMVIAHP